VSSGLSVYASTRYAAGLLEAGLAAAIADGQRTGLLCCSPIAGSILEEKGEGNRKEKQSVQQGKPLNGKAPSVKLSNASNTSC